MNEINKPKILYKYMTAETGFKILENQTINLIRNKYPKSKIFKAELSQTEFKIEFFKITT